MSQYQFQAPPLSRFMKIFLGVLVVGLLLEGVLKSQGMSLAGLLGLSWSSFSAGGIHRLFLYPIAPSGLMSVIFNALLLVYLGHELEDIWGKRAFVAYLLLSTLFTGLVYLIVSGFIITGAAYTPLVGPSCFSLALTVSYAFYYPERKFHFMFIFAMPAKYFCLLILGIHVYSGMFSPSMSAAWGPLGAMAFGALWVKAWRDDKFRQLFVRRAPKVKQKASHLSLVKDNEDEKAKRKGPKYWH